MVLKKQKSQLERYYKYLKKVELLKKQDPRLQLIKDWYKENTELSLTEYGERSILRLIKIAPDVHFVIDCLDISLNKMGGKNQELFRYACGVFYKKLEQEGLK